MYKIDVRLGQRLCKLHVSARSTPVFTRITILDYVARPPTDRHSYFNTINVIPIDSIPYLPRIRNIILFLFPIAYLIESILFLIFQ